MKRFLAIFCCTFFAAIVFAESNYGKNLFSETNNFLINQKCNPIYEPLVQSTKNDFPSNIYVNFFSPNANDYTPNIILAFTMEDTVTNKDLLKNLIHLLQTSPLQTNVTLFFSYGDSITQEVQGLVKGTDAFAKNIQEPENTIALCIGFSTSLSTRIITSGKHDIAPLWLSKALTTSLLQNEIPFVIRGGTINALFKFGILPFDLRTSFFLEQNIPAIGMLISSNYETENYISFFKTFLEEAHNNYSSEWDRHYTIFKLGENIFFANEKIMVIFFIIISFISLFALSREIILFETKKDYLKAVFFQLFFLIFIGLAITTLSLYIGQAISFFVEHFFQKDVLTLLVIKIIFSFFCIITFCTLFFLSRPLLKQRSLSRTIIIVSIFNIFIFASADLSFIFLFTLEFIIAYFSKFAKKTKSLIIFFLLMTLPFLPYAIQITESGTFSTFRTIVYSSFSKNITLSLATLPLYIQWLRIASRRYEKWKELILSKKKIIKKLSLVVLISILPFSLLLVSFIKIIPLPFIKTLSLTQETITNTMDDDFLSCTISDKSFFNSTTRNIFVHTKESAEYVSVVIKGSENCPIIFSEQEYESNITKNEDTFLLPMWPPKSLSFSYTPSENKKTIITITALYKNENEWQKRIKTIEKIEGTSHEK